MTGKRTCIHGRTERQVCRKCDDMDRAALHPVSDATPDLAAALRDRIRATLRDIEALAEMVHPDPDHPGIGVRMVSWAAVRNRIEHVLASEPVPATPACICGRAAPVAGTCFDIDGAYWSGHGEPVPATGRPDVDTEALYRENEAALIDVEALADALAATYTGGAPLDRRYFVNAARQVAAEYARQREGERP